MKAHPSFAVTEEGFYWHSQKLGGVTALDYLMQVKNVDFVSAVCQLINEAPYEKGDRPNRQKQGQKQGRSPPKPAQPSPSTASTSATTTTTTTDKTPPSKNNHQAKPQNIVLPRRNKDNYHVIAYLQNRGIDRDLIMDCINRGVLYQSVFYHNAVFLGKDDNGKTRFAAMRSITGDFKCDAEGSDKKYSFVIPPKDSADNGNLESQTVMIFESPIDCLSHQTLCKHGIVPDFDGWRLSLGGTSDVGLISFLERHPNIIHCIIATDNDIAGNNFAESVADKITISVERVHPLQGKDWNDALLLALLALRGLQRGEHANEQAKPHSPHSKHDYPEL